MTWSKSAMAQLVTGDINETPLEVGVGVFWIELDGFVEVGNGSFVVLFVVVSFGAMIVGKG